MYLLVHVNNAYKPFPDNSFMEEKYNALKKKLLNDHSINLRNRNIFRKFFEFEERKLKRTNGKRELDNASYKTLYDYCIRLKTCNKWFQNKSWKSLTKADITKVYDDLEDGVIKTNQNTPYKNLRGYYNKIFKSKPFDLAGKKDIAKEVIEFTQKNNSEVKFITKKEVEKIVSVIIQPIHKFLVWLAFDIGENIFTLLQSKKKYFKRELDTETGEVYYIINFPKEILKRSRKARGEPTIHQETVNLADIVFKDITDPEDIIFDFEYRAAAKMLDRAIALTQVKCKPKGEKPSFRDLRSSMACHVLAQGWTRDEVNARLHHSPSSSEIDRYINFLAIDTKRPKQKIYNNNLQNLETELKKSKEREKLTNMRLENMQEQIKYAVGMIKSRERQIIEIVGE